MSFKPSTTSNKPAIEGGTPVRSNLLVFGQPEVTEEDIEAAAETMRTCWLGTGPKTTEFEQKFAQYKGVKYAVGLNSCTAALHLSFLALKLQPGDEVITTDYTFTATVSTIIHAGLKPVPVDCQPKTQNIEWNKIEEKITPRTKAIVVVHFAGYPCQMDKIVDICKRYNLYLIEDCAHAIEAKFNDQHCGTFGDIGCFSFYSTKNMTTACGEGGMLISDNEDIIREVRMLALHGMSKDAHSRFGKDGFKHYEILYPGYKYNLTDVASSFALSQLSRIDANWKKRQAVWQMYKNDLQDLPLYLPPELPENIKHGCHLFTIQLKLDQLKVNRDFILNALTKEGICTGVHYMAIHTHPYYFSTYGWKADDYPNAQWLSDRTISLPLSAKLEGKDVIDTVEAIHKVLNYYRKET